MKLITNIFLAIILFLSACQPSTTTEGIPTYSQTTSIDWNEIRESDTIATYATFHPLLNPAHIKQAENLLSHYETIEDLDLIKAHIAFINGNQRKALKLASPYLNQLDQVNPLAKPTLVQIIASSNKWVKIFDFASTTEIANILKEKPLKEITKSIKASSNPHHLGWLELSLLTKSMVNTPESFVQKINSWKYKYPNHPANSLITNNDIYYPSKMNVGVILPLTGKLSSLSSSIREGIIAAHFSSTLRHEWSLTFFDSNKYTLDEIHQKGQAQGIHNWIGPLEKDKVHQFTKIIAPSDNLLALNELPAKASKNALALSLSPEEESKQAAKFSRKQGFENALIIEGNHSWSARQAKTFSETFINQGGKVVKHIVLDTKSYAKDIQHGLNIAQSSAKYKSIQKLTSTPIKFISQPRPDVDVIFLAMGSEEALQVRPLLKFNLVGDIATIATSSIVNDRSNIHRDRDLNDIIFCDSMILHKKHASSELANRIVTLIDTLQSSNSQSFKDHARFFGLGIDAYHTFLFRHRIELIPSQGILGATGRLIKDGQNIRRELDWAIYRSGQIENFNHSI